MYMCKKRANTQMLDKLLWAKLNKESTFHSQLLYAEIIHINYKNLPCMYLGGQQGTCTRTTSVKYKQG